MENEHKKVDETASPLSSVNIGKEVDDLLNGIDEKNQGSEPETTGQPESTSKETATAGSAVKPPSENVADFEGKEKGFANHPAWQEREAKLKEAEERAKAYERDFQSLLSDPDTLSKFLKNQGYSQEQINQELNRRGFQPPRENSQESKSSMAEKICKKLGWQWERLSNDQREYINDLADFNLALADERVSAIIDERLKPIEMSYQQQQKEKKLRDELGKARDLAKEEFPDLDWDKDIESAMSAYYDQLEKSDPKRAQNISALELYNEATRRLFRERSQAKVAQEKRDTIKNAQRPLVPGATRVTSGDNNLKGKTVGDTLDNAMKAIGLK